VTRALSRHVKKLPKQLSRSLTWDRGLEMAGHKRFSIDRLRAPAFEFTILAALQTRRRRRRRQRKLAKAVTSNQPAAG
jgi:hypothetical protein